MRHRIIIAFGILLLAAGQAVGQSQTDVHPGKVDIRSTAADALTVRGGVSIAGDVTMQGAATVTGALTGSTGSLSGTLTVSGSDGAYLSSNNPQIWFLDNDAAADARHARYIHDGGALYLQFFNNLGTLVDTGWYVTHGTDHVADQFVIGPSGSASAPSIAFEDESNLGMYRSTTSEIGFAVGGIKAASIGQAYIEIADRAAGTGGVPGGRLIAGRNSSGGGAPGTLAMTAKNGTQGYLWFDTTGMVRISSSIPTEVSGDTGGTVVGTQTSTRLSKDILAAIDQTAGGPIALEALRSTPVFAFRYKDGRYNGETFIGITTDDSPLFGMDQGRSFNPVTAFGVTVLAVQELERRLRALEAAR